MAEMVSYAQPLRAIGQALERLKMQHFEVETDGENFLVRGNVTAPEVNPAAKSLERSMLGRVLSLLTKQRQGITWLPMANPAATITKLDLCYTRQDIDRLEREAQGKRVEPEGAADAASVSQLLRTVGAYVNHKGARLIKITRNTAALSITYEMASGQKIEEVIEPSVVYDFWVRMYLKRAVRGGH